MNFLVVAIKEAINFITNDSLTFFFVLLRILNVISQIITFEGYNRQFIEGEIAKFRTGDFNVSVEIQSVSNLADSPWPALSFTSEWIRDVFSFPILEEEIFRQLFRKWFRGNRVWMPISAISHSLLHKSPLNLLPMNFFFIYGYEKSGQQIFVPVLLHSWNNMASKLVIYMWYHRLKETLKNAKVLLIDSKNEQQCPVIQFPDYSFEQCFLTDVPTIDF